MKTYYVCSRAEAYKHIEENFGKPTICKHTSFIDAYVDDRYYIRTIEPCRCACGETDGLSLYCAETDNTIAHYIVCEICVENGCGDDLDGCVEDYSGESYLTGFTPTDLHGTVAAYGSGAYNVDDAQGWVELAEFIAKHGVKKYTLEDAKKNERDMDMYIDMAALLDFDEDNLPEAIYETRAYNAENFIFAWC